jgi:hypothetical protein
MVLRQLSAVLPGHLFTTCHRALGGVAGTVASHLWLVERVNLTWVWRRWGGEQEGFCTRGCSAEISGAVRSEESVLVPVKSKLQVCALTSSLLSVTASGGLIKIKEAVSAIVFRGVFLVVPIPPDILWEEGVSIKEPGTVLGGLWRKVPSLLCNKA